MVPILSELQLATNSLELIRRDFGLDETTELSDDGNPMEQLHRFLTSVVTYLLEKDFGQLMNSLYRIDVSEERVKQILELSVPEQMASDLSWAIIERERQKVKTRMKYTSGH